MDIVDRLSIMLGEDVTPYATRKVNHGRKRSKASKLQGADKQKYIKMLKDRKKDYKVGATKKAKVKKAAKRYAKTSGAKRAKHLYKGKK